MPSLLTLLHHLPLNANGGSSLPKERKDLRLSQEGVSAGLQQSRRNSSILLNRLLIIKAFIIQYILRNSSLGFPSYFAQFLLLPPLVYIFSSLFLSHFFFLLFPFFCFFWQRRRWMRLATADKPDGLDKTGWLACWLTPSKSLLQPLSQPFF